MTMDTDTDLIQNVAQKYNMGALGYSYSWARPHPWLEEERRRFIRELPPGGTILDVGSGPGHDTCFFVAEGFSTVGVDISQAMVDRARSLYPHCRFINLNVLDITKLDAVFDGVWMTYVLLHIPAKKMPLLVDILQTRLNPSGILFFVTSIDDRTVEEDTAISGLKTINGDNISVYTIRWQIDELRMIFSSGFTEIWSKVETPLPNGRKVLSSIWKMR